jgi:hypothetical protein
MFYVAPSYLWLLDLFRRGLTARRFGIMCAVMVVSTFLFELVPIHYDLWRYYGPQGISLGEAPLWWGFTNGHGLIGTAVVLHLLLRVVPANRQFMLVPLMPVLFVGVHTAGSIFGYLGINSTASETAAYVGTIATCGLCSVFFWLYSKVVCVPAQSRAETPSTNPEFVLSQ